MHKEYTEPKHYIIAGIILFFIGALSIKLIGSLGLLMILAGIVIWIKRRLAKKSSAKADLN